jgi:hypothetical protein
MDPFILGFHLTIDRWRPGRDEEGWRLRQAEVEVEASLESDDKAILRRDMEARRERHQ